jgi:hypothetical protein
MVLAAGKRGLTLALELRGAAGMPKIILLFLRDSGIGGDLHHLRRSQQKNAIA